MALVRVQLAHWTCLLFAFCTFPGKVSKIRYPRYPRMRSDGTEWIWEVMDRIVMWRQKGTDGFRLFPSCTMFRFACFDFLRVDYLALQPIAASRSDAVARYDSPCIPKWLFILRYHSSSVRRRRFHRILRESPMSHIEPVPNVPLSSISVLDRSS